MKTLYSLQKTGKQVKSAILVNSELTWIYGEIYHSEISQPLITQALVNREKSDTEKFSVYKIEGEKKLLAMY